MLEPTDLNTTVNHPTLNTIGVQLQTLWDKRDEPMEVWRQLKLVHRNDIQDLQMMFNVLNPEQPMIDWQLVVIKLIHRVVAKWAQHVNEDKSLTSKSIVDYVSRNNTAMYSEACNMILDTLFFTKGTMNLLEKVIAERVRTRNQIRMMNQ